MQSVREKVGANHVAPLVAKYLTAKWTDEQEGRAHGK
jgi:hypothetical protein